MGKFSYQKGKNQNGLIELKLTPEALALNFADALYKWNIRNPKGTQPRKPIKRGEDFFITVTEEELALIEKYNNQPKPEPEQVFTVFDPLIRDAAEDVRLNFMSAPYKGAMDKKLKKKDYDEFETIIYYQPPNATYEPTASGQYEYYYRTQVESHAQAVQALLKREKKVDKPIKTRFEIKVEEQQDLSEPAGGYQLAVLEVDDISKIEENKLIKEWQNKADKSAFCDARFIAIRCQGKVYLYGKDKPCNLVNGKYEENKESKYKLLEITKAKKHSAEKAIKDLFDKVPPAKDKLQEVTLDNETAKDVVKWGKCFGSHPKLNLVPRKERDEAWLEIQKAIREVTQEVKVSKAFSVATQAVLWTNPSHALHFLGDEKEAELFKQMVNAKLSEKTRKLFGIETKKEYYVPVTEEEHKLLYERMPNDYVVRPNHGFAHSMRAAAYVPVLVQHYKDHHPTKCKDMDADDVRLLQVAMLYSVVGRETEVGFGSQAKLAKLNSDFETSLTELRKKLATADAAQKPDIEQQIKDIEEQQKEALDKYHAESTEYFSYRNTSAIAFLDYCEKSGLAKSYCDKKGATVTLNNLSKEFSQYMIQHLQELGLASVNPNKGFEYYTQANGQYQLIIPTMHYHAAVLYKMSEPDYNKFLPDGFSEIITQAHALDLMRCYPKIPSDTSGPSIGTLVDGLSYFSDTPQAKESALNVVKYTIKALEATGNRLTVGVNDKGEIVDKYTPVDFSKNLPASSETDKCIDALATVPEPAVEKLAKGLGYESAQVQSKEKKIDFSSKLPVIVTCARNAANEKRVDITFESPEAAKLFVELMVQARMLTEKDLTNLKADAKTITVSRKQFNNMQGHVRYKPVELLKEHSEEADFVTDDGEFAPLNLVKNCKALVRNVDSAKPSSVKFNFDQLEDPINNRPVTRLHLGHPAYRMAYDRQIVMDMTEKEISDTIKDFKFDIDESEVKESDKMDQGKWDAYFKAWRKKNKDPKALLVFQLLDKNKAPPQLKWFCYGEDATGRTKCVDMYYLNDKKQLDVDSAELLKRMVVHFGYYKQLTRGVKNYEPVEKQLPMDENARTLFAGKEDYRVGEHKVKPISRYTDLGKPANTKYTKKLATTLVRPDGRTQLFNPDGWTEYLPVGLLYDRDQVHLKGERYIWRSDAYTDDRFWLGDAAQRMLKDPMFKWGENISLHDLEEQVKKDAQAPTKPSKWNEMMVGLTKGALKGLFVQDNYVTSRLGMVMLYQQIRKDYKIDVPLMIMDGQNEPKMYLEKELKEDIKRLMMAKEGLDSTGVFNPKKVDKKQREMMEAFLDSIDYGNLKKQHPDIDARVNAAVEGINMIGGLKRERELFKKQWKDDDPAVQEKCLKRAQALGHSELVAEIRQKQGKLSESVHEALADQAIVATIKSILADYEALANKMKEQMDACLKKFPLVHDALAEIDKELEEYDKHEKDVKNQIFELVMNKVSSQTLTKQEEALIHKLIEKHPSINYGTFAKVRQKLVQDENAFDKQLDAKAEEYALALKHMLMQNIVDVKKRITAFISENQLTPEIEQRKRLGINDLEKIKAQVSLNDDPKNILKQIQALENLMPKIKSSVNATPEKKKGWFSSYETVLTQNKREFAKNLDELIEAQKNIFQSPVEGMKEFNKDITQHHKVAKQANFEI